MPVTKGRQCVCVSASVGENVCACACVCVFDNITQKCVDIGQKGTVSLNAGRNGDKCLWFKIGTQQTWFMILANCIPDYSKKEIEMGTKKLSFRFYFLHFKCFTFNF